jgi:hypothetical protein
MGDAGSRMQVGRFSFGAASAGVKIYAKSGDILTFMGGIVNTNAVYDTAANSWATKQPIPTGKKVFGIAAVRSRIYCIGSRRSGPMASMEIYNTLTDTWMAGTPMPIARQYASANVVNGKIYVISGKYSVTDSNENYTYDPKTVVWTTKASIPDSPGEHISAVVDNKIYMISNNLTQIYDTETDT